jgi:hypothetical protein
LIIKKEQSLGKTFLRKPILNTMKSTVVMSVLVIALAGIACKKETFEPPVPVLPAQTPTQSEYMPLRPGAYWVYRKGLIDTSYNVIFPTNNANDYDSVWVTKDTSINGFLHHEIKHSNSTFLSYYNFFSGYTSLYPDSFCHIVPGLFTLEEIGDTVYKRNATPHDTIYTVPLNFYNLNTLLGLKDGIKLEYRYTPSFPAPPYIYHFFGYTAYINHIGINRFILSYISDTAPTKTVYELVRYGNQ